jgi:hypothetical protein
MFRCIITLCFMQIRGVKCVEIQIQCHLGFDAPTPLLICKYVGPVIVTLHRALQYPATIRQELKT